MPVINNRVALEIARNVTAFLNLEAGVTRGKADDALKPGKLLQRAARRLGAGRSAAGVQSPAEADAVKEPPVFFVMGVSRSGTTWLMRLLNTHPEVLCKGEGRFFGKDWRVPKKRKLDMKKQPSSLQNALLSSEDLRFWIERSVWSREEDSQKHFDNLMRMSINYFLNNELEKTGKKIVGDKTPILEEDVIEEVGRIFPYTKVVHIVRDGRDRAVSLMHYFWNTAKSEGGIYRVKPEELAKRDAYREDPEKLFEGGEGIFTEERLRTMAHQWGMRVDTTAREAPGLLGGNYLEVKYEDLLDKPEQEAKRLFEHLGADADEKTVRRCVERVSFERRTQGREKGREDPTSVSLRKGIAGEWRDTFTERDKRVFKEVAGEALISAGYEKDLDW